MFSIRNKLHYLNRLNLKQRLILLIVITTLSSVFITGYSTLILSKNIIKNKIEVMARNTVGQVSENIDEVIISQVNNISNMLRYDTSMYDILKKKYAKSSTGEKEKLIDELILSENILQKYLSVYQDIKIAVILGQNDELYNIYFQPSKEIENIYRKTQQIAEDAKGLNSTVQWQPLQNNYFTDVIQNNIRKQRIVTANRRIFTVTTQEYLGTVVFAVDENSIFNKYSKIKLGSSGKIFIIDSKANLISSSNEIMLSKGMDDKRLIENVLKKRNDVFTYKKGDAHSLVVTYTSKINDWITVGVVPINEVYSETGKIYNIVFLVSLITILLAISVVTIVTDRVVKPIRQVVRSMEEVEKGNLDIRVDIKGEYEVSNLARYFNSMIIKIKQLMQEQYDLGKKKKQSELDALMSQINPHFLYNALDSIVWMAQTIGAADIVRMTSSLGRLLRIGINRGKVLVPISEELDHVKSYLDVQKIRYKDKFDYIFNVLDEKTLNYKTIKLILQPVVENSLHYNIGIAVNKLTIEVSAAEKEGKLIFIISDDGIGIDKENLERINRKLYSNAPEEEAYDEKPDKYKGIGLKNIHERIKLYFGEEYGITVSSIYRSGTTVMIELPVIS